MQRRLLFITAPCFDWLKLIFVEWTLWGDSVTWLDLFDWCSFVHKTVKWLFCNNNKSLRRTFVLIWLYSGDYTFTLLVFSLKSLRICARAIWNWVLHIAGWLFSNHLPKWSIQLVLGVYRATKRRGKYPPLPTDILLDFELRYLRWFCHFRFISLAF